MFNRFLSTFTIVSRIPVKVPFSFDISWMDFYLPITGIFPALLGVLALWAGYAGTDSPSIAIILMLLVQYLGFNLFHLDGLVDTADAFLGDFTREKRVVILKDSRIGTYGFFAGLGALSLKFALLYTLFPFIFHYTAYILAYPISGRLSAALIPCLTKPANPNGLGALVKNAKIGRAAIGLFAALFFWILIIWGIVTLIAPISSFTIPSLNKTSLVFLILPLTSPGVSLFLARIYQKHLDGYTGDTLGAAIELAEILHLAVTLLLLRNVNGI